jgi:hypothetical protein
MIGLRWICIAFLTCLFCSEGTRAQGFPHGKFLDELNVALREDGRRMTLLNDYRFQDPKGEIWLATKGSTVDGASIPQVFWSLIGGPLNGVFRNASVIHDYYCVTRTKDWQQTHKVFYEGMLSAGAPATKAITMYFAVLAFGPRWGNQARNTTVCTEKDGVVSCGIVTVNSAERVDVPSTQDDLEEVRDLERRLQAGNQPSLAELERSALNKGNPRFPRELRR